MPGSSPSDHPSLLAIRTWAILPGVREWVLVALVVVALYGRARPGRFLAPLRRRTVPSGRGRRDHTLVRWVVDRWMLVAAVLAGAGVAAWMATSSRVVRAFP